MTILYASIGFLIGFIVAWFIRKQAKQQTPDVEILKLNAALEAEKNLAVSNNAALQNQVEKLQQQLRVISNEASAKDAKIEAELTNVKLAREQLHKLEQRINEATDTINNLDKQTSYLNAELKYKNEQLTAQKTEIENIGKKFETEFKNLAQNILDKKTEVFNAQQERSLTDILKPLKENIENFKTEIGSRYDAESKERISLKEQIKLITETNKLYPSRQAILRMPCWVR